MQLYGDVLLFIHYHLMKSSLLPPFYVVLAQCKLLMIIVAKQQSIYFT